MKLHYMGPHDRDPDSLPHGEHKPGAVKFREPDNARDLSLKAGLISVLLFSFAIIAVFARCGFSKPVVWLWALLIFLLSLIPHELLHALCFKGDVYLYLDLRHGMVFVVGPEDMSRGRFIFLSLLPNLVFGIIPFAAAMIFPKLAVCGVLGATALSAGAGDFYNIYNALTQMPKGARTYLYKFNSYWYMP